MASGVSGSNQKFWQRAEDLLCAFDLLQHPFYQAWSCGALTCEDLRCYAKEYFHQVAAFPAYLTALHSRLPDGPLRRQVLANAADEELRDIPHSALWLDFAEAVGGNREEIQNGLPDEGIAATVQAFFGLARHAQPISALGAFWAYESQVPRIAGEKAAGLRQRYGLGEDACGYFDLHAEVDRFHAQVWKDEIDRCLANGGDPDEALAGMRTAASALWKALDSVESERQSRRQLAAGD